MRVVFPICMALKALFGLSRTYHNFSKLCKKTLRTNPQTPAVTECFLLIKLIEGKLQSGLILIFLIWYKE